MMVGGGGGGGWGVWVCVCVSDQGKGGKGGSEDGKGGKMLVFLWGGGRGERALSVTWLPPECHPKPLTENTQPSLTPHCKDSTSSAVR